MHCSGYLPLLAPSGVKCLSLGCGFSVSNVPSRYSKYKYVRNTGNGCNVGLSQNALCSCRRDYICIFQGNLFVVIFLRSADVV